MKICKKCNSSENNFTIDKSKSDGISVYCVECSRQKDKIRQRSRTGLITRIYGNQKTNAKRRGHSLPFYTLSELKEWMLSQKKYHLLYDEWVKNDFKRGLSPSCDRINDDISYVLSNLQIMSANDNIKKGHQSIRDNKIYNSTLLNGGHRAVVKISLDNVVIEEYISMAEACRENKGIYQGNISKCCLGKLNKTGNYKWRYAVEMEI